MRAAPVLLTTLFLLAAGGSAQAASFTCTASAARAVVLGQAVEPVRAIGGTTTCATESKSLTSAAAGLPSFVGGGVLVAGTQVLPESKQVVASGGLTDLQVLSLPDLPVTLPTAAVSDAARAAIAAARSTSIDLTGVKALIPVLPTNLPTNLVTNLVTNLRTDYTFTLVDILLLGLDPLTATLADITAVNTANAATNAANLLTNTTNAATNAANTITNAANEATNLVRAAIPDSVSIDGLDGLAGQLEGLLPDVALPTASLLEAKSVIAYAAGTCTGAAPAVAGSSTTAGLKVLGQSVPGTEEVDRTLTLIDAASIDPSDIALPDLGLGLTSGQSSLIDSIPLAKDALATVLGTAQSTIRSALDALDDVPVLDPTVARVVVRPGVQTKTGDTVTQEGLRVAVAIAGQTILQGVLGEARVSGDGVDCAKAITDPAATGGSSSGGQLGTGVVSVPGFSANVDTRTPEGALLACSTRRLVLVDVLRRGNRVRLTGVADPALAGRKVKIVFDATGRVVARTEIDEDGGFATTAPLPRRSLRSSNRARYTAVLGEERSSNLKLERRMVVDSMTADGRRVTIAGRVLPPFSRPMELITVSRRVSCTQEKVEKRFRPDADGGFRITVTAPKGLGAAVYRLTTHVRYSATGTGTFKTYTLPRAVELSR